MSGAVGKVTRPVVEMFGAVGKVTRPVVEMSGAVSKVTRPVVTQIINRIAKRIYEELYTLTF